MRHGLLHSFGVVTAAVSALVAGPAWADAVGPYYATPSWDQTLPASTRFIVLSNMAGAAVLAGWRRESSSRDTAPSAAPEP